MTAVQDPTVQRRRLSAELRRARDAAKTRQTDVAHAMEWSLSKIIRIERAEVSVSTNDLRALLNYYGVADEERVNELLDLARSARGTSFYDQYSDLLKPGFKEYLAYEASASIIRQYDPVLVPGLLQTEEYGRTILKHMADFGPEEVDKSWIVRQHRQEAVERENPPEMLFVMDEAALRRHVGRGHVMRHQLEQLRERAKESNVTIQIIPFSQGAHPGMAGNFILLEFAEPNLDDLVHLESINQITIREDTDLIARYLDRFQRLQELALPPKESGTFLEALSREMPPAGKSNDSTPGEAD